MPSGMPQEREDEAGFSRCAVKWQAPAAEPYRIVAFGGIAEATLIRTLSLTAPLPA